MIPGTEPGGEDGDPELRGEGKSHGAPPKPLFRVLVLTQKRLKDTFSLGSEVWGWLAGGWGDSFASILETLKGVGIERRRAGL